MTAHKEIAAPAVASAGPDRIPQLYAVLAVVEQMAPDQPDTMDVPDETALCRALENLPGIAKQEFDRVADETADAATAGAQALLGKGADASAAAAELARYLRRQIVRLGRFVGI
ncbi:hypothetical protein HFP57_17115 [Parasphingopyxis algicola]|uniref:hypothetical protein n=1 Tax=Parasphingopyxis algicola TaxID=2026624 RepID=UPI0015A39405|nr:hypothetical protein [Parasphingopyxis algicola]QLC26585.1 hypothetical protein HFP57_17115 [Parasphingopyxis algicola]